MTRKATLSEMLKGQGYKCALTGLELTKDNSSLDHIIPISRGGHPTDARNGQWIISEVNTMKGTMPNAEFIAFCKLVSSGPSST